MGSRFSFDEHLTFIFCQNVFMFLEIREHLTFIFCQNFFMHVHVLTISFISKEENRGSSYNAFNLLGLALCLTIRHVLSVNDLEPLLHWEEDVTFFILSLTLFTFYDVFGSLKVLIQMLPLRSFKTALNVYVVSIWTLSPIIISLYCERECLS